MALKKDTPEKAMRYARYIVQDIEMYNKKKVEASLATDSFFEDLKDLFSEGKEQYENQVTPEILEVTNFFERAIVDVILYRKKHLETPIWD
ncbi:MAG TPA: hypothetical protein DCE42_01520 [Myxococcales bacterium]|nr:hypothetical protein [Deltaproteobacteria bacterium]MBU49481.1 hypothetical protein [Deltaproteobacteria bacterium]HAA53402.1 hypothetical protein [Myxococcales bacterium]|tara:strand:+ start:6767 stop:7039 length:273 start_codon:yes stop_codon:yes gene_type:complete